MMRQQSLMVIAAPDGAPTFAADAEWASLTSSGGMARVQLSDGRLMVYDTSGTLLLDEHAAARQIEPVEIEGQQWFATRAQFNRGTDEGLYGLGQHQNGQMNYNGEDVELAQHNMAIAVPYLVSTRGYGLLWDNNSITRVGDPEPYEKLIADRGFGILNGGSHDHVIGDVIPGWRADYYLGEELVVTQYEETIDYQYIRDQARWPAAATAAVEAATTGQNTQGNAVQSQRVVWTGSFTPEVSGTHKFRLYSSSYVTVSADGEEVLSRWRQNWNPWYHNFELELTAGEPVELQIDWEPNQGYIALEHADPLPEEDRHSVSFASEAGRAIDYYVVPAPTMDEAIAGYRRLTGAAPMMPRWAFGFWQSRQRYETQDQLLGVLRQYREAQIPIDNIVQDWFYWPENQWGCHCFDPVRFPDPAAMVEAVHDMDARFMISVWPKFYPDTAHGQELAAEGYLYQRPLGAQQRDWVGPGYANTFYDPYMQEARDIYWRQMRETLLPLGVDAWWMDATEPDWHSNLSVEERQYPDDQPRHGGSGRGDLQFVPAAPCRGRGRGPARGAARHPALHPHPQRVRRSAARECRALVRRCRRAVGRPARPDQRRAKPLGRGRAALDARYRRLRARKPLQPAGSRRMCPNGASFTPAGSSSALSARCSAATANSRSAKPRSSRRTIRRCWKASPIITACGIN